LKLLLATTSRGKIREQRESLVGVDQELVTLESWPELDPPEEPGPTFLDNAIVKALYYHRATGVPAVGEDSGLVIDALGGEPGIRSARWLGEETPYDIKNARVLEMLSDVAEGDRSARYVSAVALADDDAIVFTAESICEGQIATEPRGDGGFGYDPIFFYPPFGVTMAELSAERKNRVSHRGQAMAKLREFLAAR
jgi:XTP/dITP diphosphohydrolase